MEARGEVLRAPGLPAFALLIPNLNVIMADQDLVTIATVKNPTEAELIRGALESIGIQCMIGNEGQAGFAGVFEIDVQVPEADAERARKELKALRREKKERKTAARQRRDAKKSDQGSSAIQELKPKPPSSAIKRKKPKP